MMRRREFLAFFAAAAAPFQSQAQRKTGRLKITGLQVVNLKVIRETGTMEAAWDPGNPRKYFAGGGSVVQIHTDQGLVGIGPGVDEALLAAAKAQLVGKDPFDTEQHAGRLRYYAGGVSYRGGANIDIALWDLIGKACGEPLYKLWGGAKDRVIPYASMIKLGTPEERAALAGKLAADGFQAIKLRLHHESMKEDLRTVETVRKATGGKMTIMVDANQAQSSGNWQPGVLWDFRRALETAKELERMGVYFLEEPLQRYEFAKLAELNRQLSMPLAGGENNRGMHEFLQMCTDGVYDILQPEPLVMEGITGLRKIGALAEAFGKRIMPHHGGGNIGTIATLHLVASWPHAPYWELLHDPPVGAYENRFAIFRNPPKVGRDGWMELPQGAGLGVEIDPSLIV
ncbi:MAG: mandelate racemase/muconate lactonizing enzyme family protein [Bryobacterales bacterium]|nr:mandelate racemase/muconate lactonizing enzyme family protein [Bryobacterales bacterium]